MQKMPMSRYRWRLSRDIPQRGFKGMQKMSRSVKTFTQEMAVPFEHALCHQQPCFLGVTKTKTPCADG